MAKMMSKQEMLENVRKKMAERSKGKRRDIDEFRITQVKEDQTAEYYFKVLPELAKGDKCATGTCEINSDLWYYENGAHFMNRQRYECPRCHDQDPCDLCQFGFDLMEGEDDREVRSRISRNYIAKSHYAVNIYFLNTEKNPEELRGKVMWYNSQRTIWEIFDATINSDDPGDEEEPKAFGIFYHPYEGCYTFKLLARHKGGYNNYEKSEFLPRSCGPLAKNKDGSPNEERIEEILAQRHVLQEKFEERSAEKITAQLEMAQKNYTGDADGTEDIKVGRSKPNPARTKAKPKEEVAEEVAEEVTEEVTEEVVEKPKVAKKAEPKKAEPKKAEPKAETEEEDPELKELLSQID